MRWIEKTLRDIDRVGDPVGNGSVYRTDNVKLTSNGLHMEVFPR